MTWLREKDDQNTMYKKLFSKTTKVIQLQDGKDVVDVEEEGEYSFVHYLNDMNFIVSVKILLIFVYVFNLISAQISMKMSFSHLNTGQDNKNNWKV